jgi:signal transduction histidine kinase
MRANILVVDDEAGPRESLRMILKDAHDVRTASSGQEALREIERQPPDLVFLDLRMPGMSGVEVLKAIKSSHPEVEVAIVTAYAAVESARVAIQCGAIDYLTKPYATEDVERIVEKALRARRRRHETDLLVGQLSKLTEAIARRPYLLDTEGSSSIANGLDKLRSIQAVLDEDMHTIRDLSELGEVAAEVTHDINNLLTVILTSAQYLMRQIESQSETDLEAISTRIGKIVRAAEDCSAMLRRVREFTRVSGAAELLPMNINEVVKSAVELERGEAPVTEKNVEFKVLLGPVPMIEGDEVALRNVIVNLIENSLDAIGDCGCIEIRTQAIGGGVRIEVRDNGCGMPHEVAAQATRAFFSTKKSRGMGLGLSIAEKVVARHGGSMRIESEQGKGTTVTIELPLRVPEEMRERPLTTPRTRHGTVVLVEDEQAMRSLMAAILEAEGYHVLTAEDGLSGLSLYREAHRGRTEPLVVVTDHEMPGMTGRDLAAHVKQLDAATPVLIVSGYISEGCGPEDALINKPFDLDEFTACVHELMNRAQSAPHN